MSPDSGIIDGHAHPWAWPAPPGERGAGPARPDPIRQPDRWSWPTLLTSLGLPGTAGPADAARRAGLSGVVVDPGWPPDPSGAGWSRLDGLAAVHRLARLDDAWQRALPTAGGPDGIAAAIAAEMQRVRDTTPGFCGWKSVIAYGTGLDIREPGARDLTAAFEGYRSGRALTGLRPLANAALLASARSAAAAGEALQLHTGLGAPLAGSDRVAPGLLAHALAHTALGEGRVVLLHAGWPYVEEAAWLASAFPRVWVDTSAPGTGDADRLAGILRRLYAVAPADRIVYGSDAHGDPREHVRAAWIARAAMNRLGGEWSAQGTAAGDITTITRYYFQDGARALYLTREGH